jgi:ribosome-associated protein
MKKSKKAVASALLKLCCRALDEKKAGDLRVFDVSEQSSITDYLVIATATSEPHLRALRVELEKAVDASGARTVGVDAARESGWVVVDLFDVMVHLFLESHRSHYGLERLWKDAVELSPGDLVATDAAPTAQPKPARRRPAKKKPVVRRKKS